MRFVGVIRLPAAVAFIVISVFMSLSGKLGEVITVVDGVKGGEER